MSELKGAKAETPPGSPPSPVARFYLLGRPVTASLSPAMHNAAFRALGLRARYDPVDVGPEDFERVAREFISRDDFAGANVTIPHKRAAMNLCATVSPEAAAAKAVNTLVRGLIGHNTDVTAVRALLSPHRPAGKGGTALLIGAGGVAAAVAVALSGMGLERLVVANRSEPSAASLAEMSRGLGLPAETTRLDRRTLGAWLAAPGLVAVINATPLKEPDEWEPLGLGEAWASAFGSPAVALDLAYRTKPTFFLEVAARAGSRTIDGREVLIAQGAAAFELWTGRKAPIEVMREAVYRQADPAPRSAG